MTEFKIDDVVEVTIRDYMPGPKPRVIGKFEAVVTAVANVRDSDPTESYEVCVRPVNWDEACDILARERSMTWTEIYELRSEDVLDNVQVDEDLRLIRRPLDYKQVCAAVDAQIEQLFIKLADEFGLKTGDVDPLGEYKWSEETLPQIYSYVYSWYTGNQPATES